MVLYEVMKFCNLGDQSQCETSNLNSYLINTNNPPLLGFLVPNNGDSWLSSWIVSKYSFFETRHHKNSFVSFNVCIGISPW